MELELETLLLPVEGQRLAWLGYLIRMCPEILPSEETIELEPNVGNWYIQFGKKDRMLMRELESSAEDWGTSKTQSNQHITILNKQ